MSSSPSRGAAVSAGALVGGRSLRREHVSVAGIARQLGTSWRMVWRSIVPLVEAMAADESGFDGERTLGVDEHIGHHVSVTERARRS